MKSISVQLGTAENQSPWRRVGDWNVPLDLPTVLTGLVVFVGYYLGAKLGFALTFQPRPVSVLWPPNSILAAALLLTPLRIWWLVLLAAFPAHWAAELQSQVPPTMILCWFISNSCEAVIGAGLIRYLISGPIRLNSLRNVGFFCLCVVCIAPFLSSFLDAGFVRWNGWGQGAYWELWRVRFISNVLAALTVAPLIVTWATSGIASLRKAGRSRYLEAGLLFVGLLSVSFAVLYKLGWAADSALLFLPLPFLLWAAVRFGSCGASTAVWIVAFSAIWSATHGHGPFSGGSAGHNALSIQMFLIVLSVPLLFLAAVIEERGNVEERFVKAFRSSPDAMLIIRRRDFCVIDVNEHWQTIFGYRREEAILHAISDLNLNAREGDLEKLIASASDGEALHDVEMSLRTKAAGVRRISLSADTVDMASEPCVVVIIRDITEQKKAEAALRQREARINLAAESANLALWVYDPEKNLAWMSEKGRAIYGFGSEEPLSRDSFVSGVHPDERQVVRNAFDRARESQETFEIEHRILKPDGETSWVIVRGRSLCDEQGKPLELIGVTIDVTAKKQADLQLQLHRQEMAHLSRVAMMGEMAASLAHELNQPLSGIISNARAGERFIDRGDVDLRELSNLLADIVADGRRAGDVIRGIQSMIRKDTPARQWVNLNDLVMNVVRMVKPDAMHHSCELETLLAPNLLALEADPIQLQQVLINLVINAFDAMRDTPLNRRKVLIATERNGDGAIRTSVRDCGVGISEEARGQLFDHFFTTKPEGLGMGLGLVRSIVESHGGTVAAENVDGGGAQFHFILPAGAVAL